LSIFRVSRCLLNLVVHACVHIPTPSMPAVILACMACTTGTSSFDSVTRGSLLSEILVQVQGYVYRSCVLLLAKAAVCCLGRIDYVICCNTCLLAVLFLFCFLAWFGCFRIYEVSELFDLPCSFLCVRPTSRSPPLLCFRGAEAQSPCDMAWLLMM
jgi:hypothetical protein